MMPAGMGPTDINPKDAVVQIVSRVRTLYSLPVVAVEVLRLTSNPDVDVRALKECIENDPALTVKILRVVNSSLFGLSREVSDLNQAIAMLGIKPLKLLVLGFSLPDNLFSEVACEQLQWYWTTTLTRAVAARELCEQMWQRSGDDAFLAGLLQDIGVLVLLGELGEPYAQFLQRVIAERIDVHRLEIESLGFDHTMLSAALLEHWNMPETLVRSISEPRNHRRLNQLDLPHAEMARVLHLAELLAQLVGQNRLSVLPELLEAGDAYCNLDKERLKAIVADLQPKVAQLAEVLSLDLLEEMDYQQTLVDAHKQMSLIAETVIQPLSDGFSVDDKLDSEVLATTEHLQAAMGEFLRPKSAAPSGRIIRSDAPVSKSVGLNSPTSLPDEQTVEQKNGRPAASLPTSVSPGKGLALRLTLAVGQCRSRRRGLSLISLGANGIDTQDSDADRLFDWAIDATCRDTEFDGMFVETTDKARRLLVLPDCERREAVALAERILDRLYSLIEKLKETRQDLLWSFCAGVATVGVPAKNFPPLSLLETSERCLNASLSTKSRTVKSLEIC